MKNLHTELITSLNHVDLCHLCSAAEATALDTHGFNVGSRKWTPPLHHELEAYFKGTMLIPERKLFIGKIKGVTAGSIQLILPHHSNQISNFAVHVDNHFVSPWARNMKLGEALLCAAEDFARTAGYRLIRLSVRENREAAIALYNKCNYKKWGYLEKYEFNGSTIIGGYFYTKDL